MTQARCESVGLFFHLLTWRGPRTGAPNGLITIKHTQEPRRLYRVFTLCPPYRNAAGTQFELLTAANAKELQ